MNLQIIQEIRKKGLLLEREVFELLKFVNNESLASEILESLERTGKKMITKSLLSEQFGIISKIINESPDKKEEVSAEKIFIKLGISIEISKKKSVGEIVDTKTILKEGQEGKDFKIFYADTKPDKKLEVKDFSGHFKSRYQQIQKFLMQRPELTNLVSIGKISGDRQSLSLIGIVTEKRITKNKNLIVRIEDLTGEINVLFKTENQKLTYDLSEIQLDDVIGVKGSGNRDMVFAYDLFYPDCFLLEKTRFNEDFSVAFISDIHAGSLKHLGSEFEKFLRWINSDSTDAQKIKYLFIVGDNVDGVGIFPQQENLLRLKSMREQYDLLASYLNQIPKRITMFMCPGQHDASRVAEPQPIISRKYAETLYNIENLILVTNPTMIKLLEGEKEFKVLMYHGASIHTFISEIPELRLSKAHKSPAKAVRHMLKRRHLSPIHGDAVYIPNVEKDPLVIEEAPDVLCTGEVHRLDIETYNGTLIITGSCWQSQTPFEEKVGNIPDPCKVPVLNLKTRELKIFDFSEDWDEENKEGYNENRD